LREGEADEAIQRRRQAWTRLQLVAGISRRDTAAVKSVATMLLGMLIALLPLNGYASASGSHCAARHQSPTMEMPQHAAHAQLHGDTQRMTMPAHDHCHCPASCIAQCGAGFALSAADPALAIRVVRNEMPATFHSPATRRSVSFELLRPPKTTGL